MDFSCFGESLIQPPIPGEFRGVMDGERFNEMLTEERGLLHIGDQLAGFSKIYPGAQFLYASEAVEGASLKQGRVGVLGSLVVGGEVLQMDLSAMYRWPSWARNQRVDYLLFDDKTASRQAKLRAFITPLAGRQAA
jgi:hypothetical protein